MVLFGVRRNRRFRLDLAPTVSATTPEGFTTGLSALWARVGVDVGGLSLAAWVRWVGGRRQARGGQLGVRDVSLGLAIGYRVR